MPTHEPKALVLSFDGTGNGPSDAGEFDGNHDDGHAVRLACSVFAVVCAWIFLAQESVGHAGQHFDANHTHHVCSRDVNSLGQVIGDCDGPEGCGADQVGGPRGTQCPNDGEIRQYRCFNGTAVVMTRYDDCTTVPGRCWTDWVPCSVSAGPSQPNSGIGAGGPVYLPAAAEDPEPAPSAGQPFPESSWRHGIAPRDS